MGQLLLIVGALLLSAAVVLAFRSSASGAAFSYLGISALRGSKYIIFNDNLLLFWALAVLIVLTITMWRGKSLNLPQVCRNYIVGGSLAGMALGLLGGYGLLVGDTAIGAVLGAVAWSRTASGISSQLKLWKPLVEIGLPAVVTMSIIGIALHALVHI